MRRLRLALLAAAAVAAAAGAILLVVPARAGGGVASPPPAPGEGAALPASGDPALAEEVILANVFSPHRAPPESRWTPPEAVRDSAAGDTDVPMPPDESMVMEDETGVPLLFGTLVGASGRQALLQLDPAQPGSRLYAVGEGDGGYRVISIAPRSVVLVGPGGRMTLRLDEEERP